MKIIVVDEQDRVIGHKERDDKDRTDINRVSGLWIFNPRKEVLIAQRSLAKVHDPGKWGPSVAGTLEEGETYASNAAKEAYEELGVSLEEKSLIPGARRFRATSHKYFVQYFFAKLDMPVSSFVLQKEEVAAVRWISIRELSEWLTRAPDDFIASFPANLDEVARFLSQMP